MAGRRVGAHGAAAAVRSAGAGPGRATTALRSRRQGRGSSTSVASPVPDERSSPLRGSRAGTAGGRTSGPVGGWVRMRVPVDVGRGGPHPGVPGSGVVRHGVPRRGSSWSRDAEHPRVGDEPTAPLNLRPPPRASAGTAPSAADTVVDLQRFSIRSGDALGGHYLSLCALQRGGRRRPAGGCGRRDAGGTTCCRCSLSACSSSSAGCCCARAPGRASCAFGARL